jgi:hypothetical protein
MKKTTEAKQKATMREINLTEAAKASGGTGTAAQTETLGAKNSKKGASPSTVTSCKLPIGGMPGA